jgi:hypothetical protein
MRGVIYRELSRRNSDAHHPSEEKIQKMTILKFATPFMLAPRLKEHACMRRCRLEECHGACCLHGVWVDPLERDDILENAEKIVPFLVEARRNPGAWFTQEQEEELAFPSGKVIAVRAYKNPSHYGGTECVFLRTDAFCALQTAGEAAGFHPWRFKPFHCIIHPLTFDEEGRITLASDQELTAEPGSCFRRDPDSRALADELAMEINFLSFFPQP